MSVQLVVFSGLQAAGKTTFYRERFAATHVHVSKDLSLANNPGRAVPVEIPRGVGQVVMPDGRILESTHARIVRSRSGVRTAFPIIL